ncbi:MAG TPA: acyltransferase [Cytophaga sp.]|nr:acyltransferase [Cytophaga sp.]
MITKRSANFLSYLHSFRGFAIINIVAGHAVSAMYLAAYHKYNWSDPILITNEIFFNHCTLYFTLISGLLFSSVLKEKSYNNFFTNKILYVFLPYLFFTLLYSVVKFQRYNFIYIDRIEHVFKNLPTNMVFGGANFVLWYIPVLFGLYILTPLFNFLLRHKKQTAILIWLIILIPLVSSGMKFPTIYGLIIGKIIYFSGAYVLGMYWGANLEENINWLKDQLIYILVCAVVSTSVLYCLHYYDIDKMAEIHVQDSVYYIQKICLAIIAIIFFKQSGNKQPTWLTKVAADSTPIYFIHGAIVFSFASLFLFKMNDVYTTFNVFIGAIGLLFLTIALSMLITFLIKKIFRKKSRMIIGA